MNLNLQSMLHLCAQGSKISSCSIIVPEAGKAKHTIEILTPPILGKGGAMKM